MKTRPSSNIVSPHSDWTSALGAGFGALTLVFLMALVMMASFGYEVPKSSRFLVILVLSFGSALASSFIGGSAAAKGQIPLPLAKTHPLQFSIAGGVAVMIIVMILGHVVYIPQEEPSPPLPSGHAIIFDGQSRYHESGFNFASRSIISWNSGYADLLVSNTNPPGPVAQFFVQHEMPPFDGAGQDRLARGGIIQLATSRLDDISECPADGYQWHWVPAIRNAVYCVLTRDGSHYAKIRVAEVKADRVGFDWVYQPSGLRRF